MPTKEVSTNQSKLTNKLPFFGKPETLDSTFYRTYNYNNYLFANSYNQVKPLRFFQQEEISVIEEIIFKRKHKINGDLLQHNYIREQKKSLLNIKIPSTPQNDIFFKFKTNTNLQNNLFKTDDSILNQINENNVLILKTVMAYYHKFQIKVINPQMDEKQIFQIYNLILKKQQNGNLLFVKNMIQYFTSLDRCSKHLLDRILLAFHKNPQKDNEIITYNQFLKFYQVIISQHASQFDNLSFFQGFFDPYDEGFIQVSHFQVIFHNLTKNIDDENNNNGLTVNLYDLFIRNFTLLGLIKQDNDKISIIDFKNCILKNQIHSKILIIVITNN